MTTTNRKIGQFVIALSIIVLLFFVSISSTYDTTATVSQSKVTQSSELAFLDGNTATIVEKSPLQESTVMFALGIGLIAVALWGRKKFQR